MPKSFSSVLVAGGAGYIGSHTSKTLQRAGKLPVVVDNLCTGHRNSVRFGPLYEGSIADTALIQKAVTEHRPASAIVFAGHAYVGESVVNPRKYFSNNVSAVLDCLHGLIDSGVRNVVFSSSCSVYGAHGQIPLTEESVADPLSPYAESKLIIERVLHWYSRSYDLRFATLRYFNAAGADPEGELGECHEPETHLIPLAISAALGGAPLRIFGQDYPTPDGTPIRDYIHVSDLATAHLRAVEFLEQGGPSMTVNLGIGRGYSVLEVISMVEQVSGKHVPVEHAGRREGDAPALVADVTRSRRLLGWEPRHSSLENMIRTAWNWHTRA